MTKQFTDKSTRKFDPTSIPALSNEARDAVNAAFDAVSTWRTEIVDDGRKNLSECINRCRRVSLADRVGGARGIAVKAVERRLSHRDPRTRDFAFDRPVAFEPQQQQ